MSTKTSIRLDLTGLDGESVVKEINRVFGENTLIRASDAEGLTLKFVSTGAYALDFAMGGGFAENRITELKGQYSALKTTVAMIAGSNFQKKYDEDEGWVLLIDAEKQFDPSYAKAVGLKLSRTLVVNPDSGEQANDVLTAMLGWDRPLFIVIDSIAALVPAAELENSADQQFMGLHPRLINRLIRMINARLKRSLYDMTRPSTTVVAINQLREKVGVIYGNPETSPGGKGKEFFCSAIVRLGSTAGDALKEDVEVNGVKRKIRFGQNVRFRIEKNKCGSSQFEEGEFEYYVRDYKGHPARSFNNEEILFRFGVFYSVIRKGASTGRYIYNSVAAKNEFHFAEKLRKDPKMARQLYKDILNAVLAEDQIVRGHIELDDGEQPEVVEDEPISKKKLAR